MFVNEKSIHNPDSRREQNLSVWLRDKNVVLDTVKEEQQLDGEMNFNFENFRDDVHEGLIYMNVVEPERPHITLVYKLPAALRTLEKNDRKTENVPTPDTYVICQLHLNKNGREYYYSHVDIHLAGEHAKWFPYTNLYDVKRREHPVSFIQKSVSMCTGHFFDSYFDNAYDKSSIMSVVNHILPSFELLITQSGNNDLYLTQDEDDDTGARDHGSHESYWEKLKREYESGKSIEDIYNNL